VQWTVRPRFGFRLGCLEQRRPGRKNGYRIVPKIIEESGGVVARDILRDKIEGKGLSRRTAYRRIEEAEKLKLIKFQKGKDTYELY